MQGSKFFYLDLGNRQRKKPRVLPTFTVLKIKTPQKRRHHRFFGEFFIFSYVDMTSFFYLSSQGQEYPFLQMTSYITYSRGKQ